MTGSSGCSSQRGNAEARKAETPAGRAVQDEIKEPVHKALVQVLTGSDSASDFHQSPDPGTDQKGDRDLDKIRDDERDYAPSKNRGQ